jgi:prepilin-type N-terminal cleavage/methylation domain-containing protein
MTARAFFDGLLRGAFLEGRLRQRGVGGQRGFTLIEVMAGALVLVVGLLASLALMQGATAATVATTQSDGATNLAKEIIDDARSIPFAQLDATTLTTRLQAMPNLADASSAAGWQVVRANTTYTLAATVCTVDDTGDGLGAHDGTFCAGGPASGSADPDPLDMRRVTASASWTRQAGTVTRTMIGLITRTGHPDAPAVSSLTSATALPVTTALSSLGFTAGTSSAAAAVRWSVDGGTQGQATGSGTSWSFTWPISSLVDGSYLVGAQALDGYGAPGTALSKTVVLNRYAPQAPTGLVAGRNGSAVEAEWNANPERDIVGYRVYRGLLPGVWTQACALTTDTSCIDPSPPPLSLLTSLFYGVAAVDRDPSGNLREGSTSSALNVNILNGAPGAPSGLVAQWAANQAITLTWTASGGDPNLGDSVSYYRIYRDGERYDRSALGSDTTWTDTETGGLTHTYHVSAVDTHLAESAAAGPAVP